MGSCPGATGVWHLASTAASQASRAAASVSQPKSGVEWNVGAKYFSKDKAVGASLTFKF